MRAKQIQSPNAESGDVELQGKYNQRMRKSLTLSSAQMLELIEDEQKFVDQIIHLNKLGKENMQADDYDTAISYLQQGQKILEYAASCGKTIDRFLIIATLHNEAAAYQKILQLYKSYDYMEAILYNLKKYFQLNSNTNITQEILEKQSPCYKMTSSYIHRKINTLIYSLQFAAISSQVQKHQIAIDSAKRALALLDSVIQQCILCNKYLKNEQIKEYQLRSLSRYCCGIDKFNVSNLCKTVRQIVLKHRVHTSEDKPHQFKLKKFSIGQVMQLHPTSFHESNEYLGVQHLVSSYWLTRIALYTSIAYYTIATELRLISKKNSHQFEQSLKFQKSKIFHLYSIKIALQFAPFFSDYHEHIIKSFKNNHQIDLNVELPESIQDEKIKQSLLDDQSFILKKSLTLSQQVFKNNKPDIQSKSLVPRRLSSGSQKREKQKPNPFQLKTKKKNAKSKSKQHKIPTTESIQTVFKQRNKVEIRKSLNIKHDKKLSLAVKSSRTKLGKTKNSPQKQKKSHEKGKDQIRRSQNNIKKQQNKKKILQQYMTFPDGRKRSVNHKQNGKKLHTQYEKSKSKSKSKNKSKTKRDFLSPKGLHHSQTSHNHNLYQNSFNFNYNIGIRSSKNK